MAHSAKRLINIQRGFCQVSSVCSLEFWLRSKFQDRANDTVYTGVDPGFFLGGGALVSCSTSTPINHIVFFFLTPCTLPLGYLRASGFSDQASEF